MTYRDEALRSHADRVVGVSAAEPSALDDAIRREREACAQIADSFVHDDGFPSQAAAKIARRIRARAS